MRQLGFASLLCLALCACGDKEPTPTPPAPDVALNFSQPIDGRGGDPVWTLKVRGTQLTLARPGQPDMTAIAPGAVITAHASAWTGVLPNGEKMNVSLYASPCDDPVDGRQRPMTAEVTLPDASPLSGCAGPASKP